MTSPYSPQTLTREALARHTGLTLLDFGTNWCGYCQAATPLTEAALAAAPEVPWLRIEDGKGRPLGRAFTVKLWPTLILLRDGQEVARLVRPAHRTQIEQLLLAAKA